MKTAEMILAARHGLVLIGCAGVLALTTTASAQTADPASAAARSANDGTDPTRPVRKAEVSFEHLELSSSFTSDVTTFSFIQPVGTARDSIRFEVPVISNDSLGDSNYGLGDIQVRFTRVAGVTQTHGWVFHAEMAFDTASRPELGTGQNVFKPTIIYARFLPGGHIFAPALGQSISVWGDKDRAEVNSTVLDLYYVPRLSNRRLYMTVDPAYTVDWENDRQFASLAVTLGYKLGPAFGGQSQIYVKPSTTFGDDRPTDWGVEVGVQLLNF